MAVTVCEECGFEIRGAVEAVLHYQKPGRGETPCERRQRQRAEESSRSGSSRTRRIAASTSGRVTP